MGANHAITEPATWDAAAPVVPDSDADMDDAPAVIEAFVTVLGKRTQWLHAAVLAIPALPSLSDYARKSVSNTFSAANTFTAAIETRDINVRGGRNIDVEGGVHADGAITSDANISTPLDMEARDFNASRNVNAGVAVSAPTLHSDQDANIDRDANVGRDVIVTRNVTAQRYRYPSGFEISLNLVSAYGGTAAWAYCGNLARLRAGVEFTGAWYALADDVDLFIPIDMPYGWVHGSIYVAHNLPVDTTPGNRFQLTVDGVVMNTTPTIVDGIPRSPESYVGENTAGWHRTEFFWSGGYELPALSTMTLRCTGAVGGSPFPGGTDGSVIARVTCKAH